MTIKSEYKAPVLRNKIDVLTKQKVFDDKLGKYQHKYSFYKKVYSSVRLVRKKSREGQADTEYVVLTHEITLRERSLPDIDETYRFRYKNLLLQAKYIDYDFDREGMVIVQCEQVVE